MDNGYIAIKKGDGETYKEGDEFKPKSGGPDTKWEKMSCHWAYTVSYDDNFNFDWCELRRPIAQDETVIPVTQYASDTKPVVDKLSALDACAVNRLDVNDTDVVEIAESQLLPEVGKDYELKPYWHKVRIVAHEEVDGMTRIVFWDCHNLAYDYSTKPDRFRATHPEQTERNKFALAAVKASERYNFGENVTAEDARQLYDWLSAEGMLAKNGIGDD